MSQSGLRQNFPFACVFMFGRAPTPWRMSYALASLQILQASLYVFLVSAVTTSRSINLCKPSSLSPQAFFAAVSLFPHSLHHFSTFASSSLSSLCLQDTQTSRQLQAWCLGQAKSRTVQCAPCTCCCVRFSIAASSAPSSAREGRSERLGGPVLLRLLAFCCCYSRAARSFYKTIFPPVVFSKSIPPK